MKIKATKELVVHFLCTLLSLFTINSIYGQSCIPSSKPYSLLNLVGANISGTTITKTSETGWKNAGGTTNLVLSEGHFITYRVTPNKSVTVGLSTSDIDYNLTTIENGLFTRFDNKIYIYENGTNKLSTGVSYTASSVFKILIEAGKVKYYCNGNLLYQRVSSLTASQLVVDFSMYDKDSQIIDLQIFKCCPNSDDDDDGDSVCDSDDLCPGNNDSIDVNQNGIPDSCDTDSTINSKSYTLTNTIGISLLGTTITKTASSVWGNAGSLNSVTLSKGGYLTYKVKNNYGVFVGLSAIDTDYNYTTIQNALYTRSDNNIYVYENGIDKSGIIKPYTESSVLKIMYKNGRVNYFCDDILIYVSSATYTHESLIVDFSMFQSNSQIIDLQLFESCVVPIFENIGIIGNGAITYQLPTTSSNGIIGTWNPSILAEGEQEYTFTPNAGSCSSPITMSFLVLKPKTILAFDDNFNDTAINGNTGGITPSVFTNDEINFTDGVTSTNATVNLLAVTPTALFTLNPSGTITIPSGTPAGTYNVDYKITSIACPLNNDTATATVVVTTNASFARKAKPKAAQNQLTEKITVYPNPSTAIFNIDLTGTNSEYKMIKVYNVLGQTMYQGNLVPKASNPIDLSNAPSGYYMARVSSNTESTTFNLIKK